MSPEVATRNRTRILIAFAAVYFVWGSTYLAIKYGIETIPPFLMGATRFLVAGLLLYAFARSRGGRAPDARDWRSAAITGILMLGAGNGGVMWAEQTVPSGVVALIVSTVPIFIVLLDWLRPAGKRPTLAVFAGLAIGLAGMVILVGPRAIVGQGHVDSIGTLVLLVGTASWALGTILTRGSRRSGAPLVYASLQMLAAAVALLVMSLGMGEWRGFSIGAVSLKSALSWVYLILAGSIIGYTAYVYLLGQVSAAKAATYAYVNPIIAVVLGWAFASEPIGWRTIIAAIVTLAGVAMITTAQSAGRGGPSTTGEHHLPPSGDRSQRERPAA